MVDHGGKRHRLIQIIAVIVSTLTVALVWPLECPAAESLVIPGTGDGQELFKTLAQAYERIHPGATIGIPPSIDSGGGIRATADGECPIGRVARPPKPKEKRYNLTYRPLARTPLVIAVNPSVTTVRTLSQAQLVGVFSGEIKKLEGTGRRGRENICRPAGKRRFRPKGDGRKTARIQRDRSPGRICGL
jgi:ABC-type phosphate transport system substrate-binding protein